MSNKVNKQRMKKRLIAACVYHGIIDGLELAVLGQQHQAHGLTHKELKRLLRSTKALLPVMNGRVVCSDGLGGYVLADRHPSIAEIRSGIRKARHISTGLKSL